MRYFYFLIVLILFSGCSEREEQKISWDELKKTTTDKKVLVFVGDSLTAGYQLPKQSAFPYLIGKKLVKSNYITRNTGKSGATSAYILENLDWYLQEDVRAVFLCIGANDGLRGKSINSTKENIEKIIDVCRKKKIVIAMAGIMLPINYGKEYRAKFYNMYKDIVKSYNVPFMPFLLKDVAGVTSLNLEDGIHPNEKGHEIISDNVFNFIMKENLLQ
ncbi:arylesterase [Candidatus Uabimicrobium sp. HlEnr_7]|uniref:arylesterase n=1 Tax=Candidatus Uabimicrobium helgolandensis TaxID=3095367 RepID=UPI003556F712